MKIHKPEHLLFLVVVTKFSVIARGSEYHRKSNYNLHRDLFVDTYVD
jgi:hypothetical protein